MIYDCCVRQKKCRSILKHVLKRSDNRKSCRRPVVSLSHATKSYRVNRPLDIYSISDAIDSLRPHVPFYPFQLKTAIIAKVAYLSQDIQNTLKCLASILHIGNIAFAPSNLQTVVQDPAPVKCGR